MTDVRVLRVFTREGEGGNHLGVVENPAGLDTTAMQVIAAELGYSETIFVDGAVVRIFTPNTELPFAGHPIVGAAWVLGDGADGAEGAFTIEIGEVRYSIHDGMPWVTLDQPGTVGEVYENEAGPLGLPTPAASWLVELPLPYLVLEYDDEDDVAAAQPDMAAIAATGKQVYIVAEAADHVRARFFAPSLGVPEDPATGSAAVALAAIRAHQGVAAGNHVVHQGEEIGWPCAIHLSWGGHEVSLGGMVAEDEPTSV